MAALQGVEILLIEDSADLRIQIRKLLESDGATVLDARTARSGVDMAALAAPHLIICDLSLPGSSGFLALTELKRSASLAMIPVLVLSSARDRTFILRAMASGAVDCLLKPFQGIHLLEKVEKLTTVSPYGSYLFAEQERYSSSLTVPMEILSVSEGGFTVEAPVMLGPEVEVKLDTPLLAQLGCTTATTRTTTSSSNPSKEGGFVSEVNLMGVGAKSAKIIRSFLRNRQLEGPL